MRRSNRVDSKTKQMDPVKLQIRSGVRSNLFSRNPKTSGKSNFFIFAAILIALALFLCYAFFFRKSSSDSVKRKYSIIIDGGSTGTRIHVFKYRVEVGNAMFDFGKDGLSSMRVNPGLSSFPEDPDGAGRSLLELLLFGKVQVPMERWRDTEIRLMATAGLRMLDVKMQERILASCKRVLRSSGFKFRDEWASVITGSLPHAASSSSSLNSQFFCISVYYSSLMGEDTSKNFHQFEEHKTLISHPPCTLLNSNRDDSFCFLPPSPLIFPLRDTIKYALVCSSL